MMVDRPNICMTRRWGFLLCGDDLPDLVPHQDFRSAQRLDRALRRQVGPNDKIQEVLGADQEGRGSPPQPLLRHIIFHYGRFQMDAVPLGSPPQVFEEDADLTNALPEREKRRGFLLNIKKKNKSVQCEKQQKLKPRRACVLL